MLPVLAWRRYFTTLVPHGTTVLGLPRRRLPKQGTRTYTTTAGENGGLQGKRGRVAGAVNRRPASRGTWWPLSLPSPQAVWSGREIALSFLPNHHLSPFSTPSPWPPSNPSIRIITVSASLSCFSSSQLVYLFHKGLASYNCFPSSRILLLGAPQGPNPNRQDVVLRCMSCPLRSH